LYSSPSKIKLIKSRRMRWAGHVAQMGEKRKAYRILVGKPDGKRLLRRPRRRCVNNIKKDLRDMDWIVLDQDRDQWRACEHGNEPLGSIQCWEIVKQMHSWQLFKKG
jgi:hypothetical protein